MIHEEAKSAYDRARILREAHEISIRAGKTVSECILYIDTDSVHVLCERPKTAERRF